jgi:hypothetical protein
MISLDLQAILSTVHAVERQYGSVARHLTEVGLTAEKIQRLRAPTLPEAVRSEIDGFIVFHHGKRAVEVVQKFSPDLIAL